MSKASLEAGKTDGQGVCPVGEEDGRFQSTVQNAERGNPEGPASGFPSMGFDLVS